MTEWSEDEVQIIRSNWGKITAREIGAKIGRTHNSVISKAKHLGLVLLGSAKIPWSESDIETLKTKWGKLSAAQIGAPMGRRKCSVLAMAYRLKLVRLLDHKQRPHGEKKKKVSAWKIRTRTVKAIPQQQQTFVVPLAEPQPLIKKFTKLTDNQCRYPHGDPVESWCGAIAVTNRPYCPYHMQVAFFKPTRATRRLSGFRLYAGARWSKR